MLQSRFVELYAGQDQQPGENRSTVSGFSLGSKLRPEPGYRDLFLGQYDIIRATCLRWDEPGLTVFAIHRPTGKLHGSLHLAAGIGEIRSAVVGRHSSCDLILLSDPMLSLRHLLITLEPVRSFVRGRATDLAYRAIDLRTALGFRGEEQRLLRSITCEGPAFLSIGDYALLLLPTGDPSDFPCRAEDAWACLPERVYLREISTCGGLTGGSKAQYAAKYRRSAISLMPEPVFFERALVDDGEHCVGVLHVSNGAVRQTIELGAEALRRGVLLGRSTRCDSNSSAVLGDERVSRVHLLVMRLSGVVHAIDLASSNGTGWRVPDDRSHRDQPIRARRLGEKALLTLGDGGVRARWLASRPVAGGSM